MKFFKTKVYDLQETLVASGYPMLSEYSDERTSTVEEDLTRAIKLANFKTNSGHCNFLKGILVSTDILASTKWWIQANRYGHFTIVSSMSTMHRAKKMDLEKVCPNIPKDMLRILAKAQKACNDGKLPLHKFVRMLPADLEYCARVTTNYLQLRTMYNQRKGHTLPEWEEFCKFCEDLPFAEVMICNKYNKE